MESHCDSDQRAAPRLTRSRSVTTGCFLLAGIFDALCCPEFHRGFGLTSSGELAAVDRDRSCITQENPIGRFSDAPPPHSLSRVAKTTGPCGNKQLMQLELSTLDGVREDQHCLFVQQH